MPFNKERTKPQISWLFGWGFMAYQTLMGFKSQISLLYVYDFEVNSLFLNELLELICSHSVEWLQLFLFNSI